MSLDGKTILITGATDGVGRHVAEALGRSGAEILVHGRDQARGDAVVATIRAAGGTATFLRADFSALAEVRALADTILGSHRRLDVLINNAGVGSGGSGGRREISRDGHELRFAVNYLAGFLLTRRLLPLLLAAGGGSRIVNVASMGQQPIDFADVMLEHGYDGRRAYRQSKLAQIMFTFDLAQECDAALVTANCLHPATFMDTTMVRATGQAPLSTVAEGAEAILHLATGPDMAGRTGLYYEGLRPGRANPQATDVQARDRLRRLSEQLTGL
jgi:NAD(P)-dependent dehydrogenase (short-subunit alcohol dehydrogenase family)